MMKFETGDYVKMGTKESSLWGRVVWTATDGYRARVDFKTFTADVVANDIITARRKPGDKLARDIVHKAARAYKELKTFHYKHFRFRGCEIASAATQAKYKARDSDVYELYQQQRAMLGE